jgi:hypothetical protein
MKDDLRERREKKIKETKTLTTNYELQTMNYKM